MFHSKLYPPEWEVMRREKLQRAGYRCEVCGVRDRSIQQNTRTGQPYMVHLSIAHKNQYETWKQEAETMVLCQRCHRRYDRQFRRKGGRRMYTPVGYASLYVEQGSRKALAGQARTLDELRDLVASLPPSTDFEIQLVMTLAIVGNGYYRKEHEGFTVLREYGACDGLALLLGPTVL